MAESIKAAAAARLLRAERELREAQEELRRNPDESAARERYSKAKAEEKEASAWAEAITSSPSEPCWARPPA